MNFESIETEIRGAINYSVNALNNVKPDWLDHMPLNVSCINVMDPNACPLHYAFGDFWDGYWMLSDRGYERELSAFTALWSWEELSDDDRTPRIGRLISMWREVISELRDDQS